jgi:hypothetical protein
MVLSLMPWAYLLEHYNFITHGIFKMKIDDYNNCRREFSTSLSRIKNIKYIFERGTVSTVGLSDLDFLIVVDDEWSIKDTVNYLSVRSSQSKLLQQLIGEGTVLVVQDSIKNNIKIIDDSTLINIYGDTEDFAKDYDVKEYEIMRILDWLPERVIKLCQSAAMVNVNNMISVHAILKSLSISFGKINKLLADDDYNIQYKVLSNRLIELRRDHIDEIDGYNVRLYQIITDFIDYGVLSMYMVESYLKEKEILCSFEPGGSNQFRCFNLKSNESYNVFGKHVEVHIPNVFFLNYYLQSIQDTSLSVLIRNELTIAKGRLTSEYHISDQLESALESRNKFVNENLQFLKKNNFKDGLLKYGMFL